MKLPLACPSTRQNLHLSGHEYVAAQGTSYPLVGGIPWLFPDPKHTLAEWRERANLSIEYLEREVEDLKAAAKTAAHELTQERLENLRKLKIRHLEMLRRVLEPLKPAAKMNLTQKKAYGYRLPLRQGLLGYFPNLVRDWSGSFEIENAQLLDATLQILRQTKPVVATAELRILVLGAGGSRLAYDLAKTFPKSQVIAFDLNPVLLLTAKAICEGRKISATEMSNSPKDSNTPGRAVELAAPADTAANLQFVFGDVYALPFQASSFDICVSPWLVDIVPRHLRELCASVANAVKPGGLWVNSGSWHFDFANETENFSLPEAEAVASANGWIPKNSNQTEVAYLQSPFDAHRRYETVTQFCWQRSETEVTPMPPVDDRASWVRNPNAAVPISAAFSEAVEIHATMALILSLVDGQKSLKQIADALAQENGLTPDQALEATQTFFDRFVKDRRFRDQT